MQDDKRLWALVDGDADASGYGSMDWSEVNGAWRARVPVAAAHFDGAELSLEMLVRAGARAGQPSVVLLLGDEVVRRVDVNGWHRESGGAPRQQTHVQGNRPAPYFKWLEPEEFPEIPLSGPVSAADYYRVFTAAAAVVGVDVQGVDWGDPPEGSPS